EASLNGITAMSLPPRITRAGFRCRAGTYHRIDGLEHRLRCRTKRQMKWEVCGKIDDGIAARVIQAVMVRHTDRLLPAPEPRLSDQVVIEFCVAGAHGK